jgi:hypothetical protein
MYFSTSVTCFAGAWTLPQGKHYLRIAYNYYKTDDRFADGGGRADFEKNGDFLDTNASFYLEYGLFPRLSLVGNFVYKYLEYEDDGIDSKTYGLGDMEVAARYLLLAPKGGALSLQGLVKIPEAYDETDTVPLGNGQYDVEVRLLYGHSLYPVLPGYVNVEAGYRFRFEEPADEFRYLVEVGGDFTKHLYGRVKLDGILGMGNGDDDRDAFGNPTATEAYDLGKLDICLGYKITKRYAVELGCTPSLYGKNTAAGTTWSVAFVIQ